MVSTLGCVTRMSDVFRHELWIRSPKEFTILPGFHRLRRRYLMVFNSKMEVNRYCLGDEGPSGLTAAGRWNPAGFKEFPLNICEPGYLMARYVR